MLPTVSVIIPTYNYGQYIEEAIMSVLSSTFPLDNTEIIVVDDGSTDDTANKVSKYKGIVKYFYQNNSGKASATRSAINNTQGTYIFNLDADDFFLPHKIQTVVDVFEADPEILHVGHPATYLDIDRQICSDEQIPNMLLGEKILGKVLLSYFYRKGILFGGGSTFAARSDILKRVSIPKEVDMYIDEYMVLATLNKGYSFFHEQPLSVWRIHGSNYSSLSKEVRLQKLRRSFASVEAVKSQLSLLDIDEEIKRIYQLKALTLSLALKEQSQEKNWGDIVNLWFYIFQNLGFFGLETASLVRQYHVLNRSLPVPVLAKLKQLFVH